MVNIRYKKNILIFICIAILLTTNLHQPYYAKTLDKTISENIEYSIELYGIKKMNTKFI
jgi:hypothetical protein